MISISDIKLSTLLSLAIGGIVMLFLSYISMVDWSNKVDLGQDWSANLIYHPITGVIGVILITLFILFTLEKRSMGFLEKIGKFIEYKSPLSFVFTVLLVSSFIILGMNSIMIIQFGFTGNEYLFIFHLSFGIILGVSFVMVLAEIIIGQYLNSPISFQKYVNLIVIIILAVFIIIVTIGSLTGQLNLNIAGASLNSY